MIELICRTFSYRSSLTNTSLFEGSELFPEWFADSRGYLCCSTYQKCLLQACTTIMVYLSEFGWARSWSEEKTPFSLPSVANVFWLKSKIMKNCLQTARSVKKAATLAKFCRSFPNTLHRPSIDRIVVKGQVVGIYNAFKGCDAFAGLPGHA